MEVILSLHMEALEEGGYVPTCEELPGLVAQGRTIAEMTEIARDVARKLMESYKEHGDPLPSSLTMSQPSSLNEVDVKTTVGVA